MTLRQWPVPGVLPSIASVGLGNGSETALDRPAFSWEEWFAHASTQQRAVALGLAKQQGLVYPHQLPTVSNGTKTTENGKTPDAGLSSWLAKLFAGKPDLQAAPKRESIQITDSFLDVVQSEAVARAIASPDLFLLSGSAGTGKSRVVTEILAQANIRGWRTLFLAGHTESIDVALEPLASRSELFALRYLDKEEKPERLSAVMEKLTAEVQKKSFRERLVTRAKESQDASETACRTFHRLVPVWSDLVEALRQIRETSVRLQLLREELAGVSEQVMREVDSPASSSQFALAVAASAKAHADELAVLDAEAASLTDANAKAMTELAGILARITMIEPAYTAKTAAKFWSLSFWSNLFNSALVLEMQSLLQQKADGETRRDKLIRDIDALNSRRTERLGQYKAERQKSIDEEILRRSTDLAEKIAATETENQKAESTWVASIDQLGGLRIEKTDASIAQAREAWDVENARRDQQCRFAQQWTRYVDGAADSLADKLPGFANLIATTISRWHGDVKFHEAFASPMDLLVIEDGENLTEADVLKLSRHARKVIMIGAVRPDASQTTNDTKSRSVNGASVAVASAWNRLWHGLSATDNRSPCSWKRIDGRLICQLQPLSTDDLRHVETETLADSPDIELRILHRPRSRPCLAEMSFAPRCEFVEAFLFMTREVQEFPLEALGRTAWWSEDEKHICRWFGLPTHHVHDWIELERGLRLAFAKVGSDDLPRVLVIEFDRSAGWDRTLADAWLHTHRAAGDNERTVYLQTPYRFSGELADPLRKLELGDWLLTDATPIASGIEFLPIPAVSGDWPGQGAGLEQDLTAPRHSDKLPSILRSGLPNRGYANLYEAQAVVRRIEALIREESPQSVRPQVAVVALYDGQIELIRKLMDQSSIIKGRPQPIDLTTPAKLRQRECDVLILSLTRSHAHRAVSYGDDFDDLQLMLTRARRRIVLIGDPGTLVKRAQTSGPIERRDAQNASREQMVVTKLVNLIHANVPVPNKAPG